MSIKQKLLGVVTAHPKLATLGIGLAITMAIGTGIGMLDHQYALGFNDQSVNFLPSRSWR